jgi:hypothetical protein
MYKVKILDIRGLQLSILTPRPDAYANLTPTKKEPNIAPVTSFTSTPLHQPLQMATTTKATHQLSPANLPYPPQSLHPPAQAPRSNSYPGQNSLALPTAAPATANHLSESKPAHRKQAAQEPSSPPYSAPRSRSFPRTHPRPLPPGSTPPQQTRAPLKAPSHQHLNAAADRRAIAARSVWRAIDSPVSRPRAASRAPRRGPVARGTFRFDAGGRRAGNCGFGICGAAMGWC